MSGPSNKAAVDQHLSAQAIKESAKEIQAKLKSVLNKPKMVTMQIKTLDEMVDRLRSKEQTSRDTVASCQMTLNEVNKKIDDIEGKVNKLKMSVKSHRSEKALLETQLARTYVTMEGLVDSVRSRKQNVDHNTALMSNRMNRFNMQQERGYTSQSHRLPETSVQVKTLNFKSAAAATGEFSAHDMLMKASMTDNKFRAGSLTERKQPDFSASSRLVELSRALPRMKGHKSFKSETVQSLSKQLLEKTRKDAASLAAASSSF